MIYNAATLDPEAPFDWANENTPLIGWENLAGSVVATSENSDFPAVNLLNPQSGSVWKSLVLTTQYLTFPVGALCDYLGIAAHNFGTAVVPVSVEGGSDVAAAANLRLEGTAFGDLTGGGNLAAAYDNTTSQAAAAAASKASATTAYIGKDFGAGNGKRIFSAVTYGTNDAGYVSGANPSVTITLRASNSAPSNYASDGVSLGSVTFTDTANESATPRTIISNDNLTTYRYVWRYITQAGGAATMAVAEAQLFEATGGWTELVPVQIPDDDSPIIFRWTPAIYAGIRLKMAAAAALPQAAVIFVGNLLLLQRRIYVGHTPLPLSRNPIITSGLSQNGSYLGRIKTGETVSTSFGLQNLTPSWYRQYLDPFVEAGEGTPFFFAWRPGGYPDEVGYAWLTNTPKPSNQRPNGMMQIDFSIAGIVT